MLRRYWLSGVLVALAAPLVVTGAVIATADAEGVVGGVWGNVFVAGFVWGPSVLLLLLAWWHARRRNPARVDWLLAALASLLALAPWWVFGVFGLFPIAFLLGLTVHALWRAARI